MQRFKPSALVCALTAIGAISTGAAFAQSTPPASAEANQEADKAEKKEQTVEKVSVTGSRIFRAGFDTLEPATVVSRKDIESQGITNIADALRIPGFGAGITPEGNQSGFGVAVNFVTRFGLGSNRTLSLINGRRVVSANTPSIFGPAAPGVQVDLNIIPTQMVERIENLAIGGAPTYGADAIAGVVNIVTRNDFEGLEANSTYGLTSRNDAERYNLGVLWGKNFMDKRANVMLSYVYDQQDGVLQTARPRFARSLSAQPNPCLNGASSIATTQPGRTPANDGRVNTNIPFQTCLPTAATDGIANSVLIENLRFFTFTGGGVLFPATGAFNLADGRLRGFGPAQTNYLHFNSSGALVAYNPGINFGTLNASGGDGFNLTETGQITSDLKRHTVNLFGTFKLTNDVEAFYEGLLYQAKGVELIDQSIYNVNLFGGASAMVTFPSNYPLLNAATQATLATNGITSFRLSRASRDLVNNNASSETKLRRSVIGARGGFDIGSRGFKWEVSGNFGTNEASFFANVLNQQNFVNALNVTRNAAGNVVCTTTPTPGLIIPVAPAPQNVTRPIADPRCVPLNWFGEGIPSAEAKAYLTGQTRTESKLEQEVWNANIGGSPVDIWSGPVSMNIGFERRSEKGTFTPDAFQQAGLGRAVPILGNQGKYSTKEIFGEVIVPLVDSAKNIPFLNRLDLTGKFRRVDSTVNGVADTYTYGFQWRPVSDVELRGNFTKALRSPAITELFTPVSNIFTFVPDPCDSRNVAGGTNPAVRGANCADFYRQFSLNPSAFQSTAVNATIPGTLSGSPTLQNERSEAKTIGVVLQPRWVRGLRISMDYYMIEISNTIANLNATAIATGCYDNPDKGNSFCGRITRDAAGQITGIRTGFVNGGFLNYSGAAIEAQYTADLARDWGIAFGGQASIAVSNARATRFKSSTNRVTTTDSLGTIGTPANQTQVNFGYSKGPVEVSMNGSYIGASLFSTTNTPETQDILKVDSYWLWGAGGRYTINKNLVVRVAVNNLFDKEPPFPLAGGAIGVYDILGRRYSVSFAYKF